MNQGKNKNIKSLFVETINSLKELNENKFTNYSSLLKSVNYSGFRNNIVYAGIELQRYSLLLKKQKMDKPERLYVAGS